MSESLTLIGSLSLLKDSALQFSSKKFKSLNVNMWLVLKQECIAKHTFDCIHT